MTEHPEHDPSHPPARPLFNDGWWDKIIEAILEDLDGPRETRERGLGR